MKKRLISVILAILLAFALIPTVQAAPDTTPPSLINFGVNSPPDGVSFKIGDTLVVTVHASDLESGINLEQCIISCRQTQGTGNNIDIFGLTRVEGTTDEFQGAYTFFDSACFGTYTISNILLVDNNPNPPNQYGYSDEELPSVVTFKVDGNYIPPKGPDITGFSLSKKTANVGETVTFTLTAKDTLGVASASMKLEAVTAPWYYGRYSVPLSPVSGKPGVFTGSFKITSAMPQSEYYPCDIVATSKSGVSTRISWASDTSVTFGKILKVYNPNLVYLRANSPLFSSFTMSSHKLIPGQKIAMTLTMKTQCGPFDHLIMSLFRTDTGEQYFSDVLQLRYVGSGKYAGTVTIPFNFRPGSYLISAGYAYFANGDGGGICGTPEISAHTEDGLTYIKGSGFTVSPVLSVSGTANKSILVGSTFNAMQGVTARNAYTGDVTDKITVVGGDIDTSTPGLSLVKYVVNDSVTIGGVSYPVSYTDYRWIGVTEVAPSKDSQILAVTNDSLNINVSNKNDISMWLNGKKITYASKLTASGQYSVITKSSLSTAGASSKQQAKAAIDRSGPTISPAWNLISNSIICINPHLNDISKISVSKWLPGKCSFSTVKAKGTVFNGTFNVKKYGYYTVYAKDSFGNESVKVFKIAKIRLRKITLNYKSRSLRVGGTLQLSVKFTPSNATDRRIKWTSGNRKIATVDSKGKVHALKKGRVTITARSATGKRVTCRITIK